MYVVVNTVLQLVAGVPFDSPQSLVANAGSEHAAIYVQPDTIKCLLLLIRLRIIMLVPLLVVQ